MGKGRAAAQPPRQRSFAMWKWILFVLFCGYATVEAAVMLSVGERIGVGWTVAEILGSAIAGALLVRVGGLQTLLRIHRKLRDQELPTYELLDMVLILVGGMMLIFPGYISDATGLALQLRPVRWVLRALVWGLFGSLFPEPTVVRPPPRPPPGGPGTPEGPRGPMSDEVIEVQAQK